MANGKYEAERTTSDKIAEAWKAVVAVLTAVVVIGNSVAGVVVEGYGDGVWDSQDTMTAAFAVLGAVAVYLKANKEVGKNGVMNVDFSDPMKDKVDFVLDGPPENLLGMDVVSFRVNRLNDPV